MMTMRVVSLPWFLLLAVVAAPVGVAFSLTPPPPTVATIGRVGRGSSLIRIDSTSNNNNNVDTSSGSSDNNHNSNCGGGGGDAAAAGTAGTTTTRRHWITSNLFYTTLLSTTAATTMMTVSPPVVSAATKSSKTFQTYTDKKYGFTIDIPSTWKVMEDVTALSDRRSIVVYTDPMEPSTSILIVYTPIRDDYTTLASFGSVDQVAVQTILPKGNLFNENDNTIVAKMLSATSSKQSYLFDYIQQVPAVQQPLTHYRTIFTLGSKTTAETVNQMSAGATLITITLQTPERLYHPDSTNNNNNKSKRNNNSNNNNVQSTFDTIINSYSRV